MKKALFRQKYSEEDGVKVISTPVEEEPIAFEEGAIVFKEQPEKIQKMIEEKEEGKKEEVKKRGRKHII